VRTATRRLAVAAPLNAHQAVGITVEVPVNAAAELHLPASAGARTLVSGRALERRGDLAVISCTERRAVVALGSGRHVFGVAR
jgi:hypothetical protein